MKCPNCKDISLTMSERSGVEIDYCPECRGVWLDRGELDKIIDKANAEVQKAAPPQAMPNQNTHQAQVPPNYEQQQQYYKYKRKKSFLEEIFD